MSVRYIKMIVVFIGLLFSLSACTASVKYDSNVETVFFTDSADRTVEIPKEITKIAPSGAVATMILTTLCPELLICVSGSPSSSQYKYLPPVLMDLPTTGQLYGSKSTINFETLIKVEPQIIIDLGDRKDSVVADMDALQKTTGIATVYIEADLDHLAAAYRSLGKLLGLEERAEKLASFVDETVSMAEKNAQTIKDSDKKRIMYTSGTSGLDANAQGSVQSQVIDIIGAKNAIVVEDISNQGGGNTVSLEQLYNFNPEIIIFSGSSIYSRVHLEPSWSNLEAVKNGAYYEIPNQPYNWMSNPPSMNMVLGIWWLGNLVYPKVYDYDITQVTQEFYRLFWNYELTEEEAHMMLANSTFKEAIP